MDNTELKEARKELKEAKEALEKNGYQKKLVYKLSYQKNGIRKNAYFDDQDEAYTMIDAMQKINAKVLTYSYITVKKYPLWRLRLQKKQSERS